MLNQTIDELKKLLKALTYVALPLYSPLWYTLLISFFFNSIKMCGNPKKYNRCPQDSISNSKSNKDSEEQTDNKETSRSHKNG